MSQPSWFEEINHNWVVTLNPFGGGLVLTVDRGIPCEAHTQVFSHHATNTPSQKDVAKAIHDHREFFCKAIDQFVLLSISMDNHWEAKESIGSLFCSWLIQTITKAAEKNYEKRTF